MGDSCKRIIEIGSTHKYKVDYEKMKFINKLNAEKTLWLQGVSVEQHVMIREGDCISVYETYCEGGKTYSMYLMFFGSVYYVSDGGHMLLAQYKSEKVDGE